MSKIVRKTLSECKITAKRKQELAQLAAEPDKSIILDEQPELGDEFWSKAVRNPFYRPIKKQITLRLDADVIEWLRQQGKGYQTRANVLLRDAMLQAMRPRRQRVEKGARKTA